MGYFEEAQWDACCDHVLRQPLEVAGSRPITELSGGERKRLVLESLLSSDVEIVLLDEPDNFLDLAGKRWLERTINASNKTILFVTPRPRVPRTRVADSVVTLEGFGAWTHPARFATYDEARRVRHADQAVLLGRWEAEEQRLRQNYRLMKQRAASSDANAGRAKAAESRWQRFVAAGPPPPPPAERTVHMRLKGSRTGDLVLPYGGARDRRAHRAVRRRALPRRPRRGARAERQRQVAFPPDARRRPDASRPMASGTSARASRWVCSIKPTRWGG